MLAIQIDLANIAVNRGVGAHSTHLTNNMLEHVMADSLILPPNSKAIPLTQGFYTIVDDDWYEMLKGISLFPAKSGMKRNLIYAHCYSRINGKTYNESLHRVILDAPKGMLVDHINHNTLDNRKSNLRLCTPHQNLMNLRSTKGTSKYKGVYWSRRTNKWIAMISVNGKNKHIGYFINEEDAARAYDEKANIFHGEFACLNLSATAHYERNVG